MQREPKQLRAAELVPGDEWCWGQGVLVHVDGVQPAGPEEHPMTRTRIWGRINRDRKSHSWTLDSAEAVHVIR